MAVPDHEGFLEEALALLQSVKGKKLSFEERQKKAVELASFMLSEALKIPPSPLQKKWKKFSELLQDSAFRSLFLNLTDQCFRSKSKARTAHQINSLLQLGIPSCLPFKHKFILMTFRLFGSLFPGFLVPIFLRYLKGHTTQFFFLSDSEDLNKHISRRKAEGAHLNVYHLSENAVGEQEGKNWLQIYLKDLENPKIQYVSIKLSSLGAPFSPETWEYSLEKLAEKLRVLYRAAMIHGGKQNKFITLDMESYSSMRFTCELFQKVLSEKEFLSLTAGIVLQSYLPESYQIQQELTSWAKERLLAGGAPIKICLVKGSYLEIEQVEASKNDWPQAPFTTKTETDANFKKMLLFGMNPSHTAFVRLGVATHNIFDIAYALLLAAENELESFVDFELFDGRIEHICQVLKRLLKKEIILHIPLAMKFNFHESFHYIIRRIDENIGSENFLRVVFALKPSNRYWEEMEALFSQSCEEMKKISSFPRRSQNRLLPEEEIKETSPIFQNDPKTDFSLSENRKWAAALLNKWKAPSLPSIPFSIGDRLVYEPCDGIGFDPSHPDQVLYRFALANRENLLQAISIAKKNESSWAQMPLEKRNFLMTQLIEKIKERRGDLIGSLMLSSGKCLSEADREICNAIDTVEYYKKRLERLERMKDLSWSPKGTFLIMTSWRESISLPIGHIAAALLTGNVVLFKPAIEAPLTGWQTASLFWDAGFPKEVLQFLIATNEESSRTLVLDKRISSLILSGQFATAKKVLEIHPGIDLIAHTNGKNAVIISSICDRRLAIENLIASAFHFSGQKYSSASLALLEEDVYHDVSFLRNLRDAASSLKAGSVFDLNTKIGPLLHRPSEELKRNLTTLDKGEEWLLQPKEDPSNPHLWTPGIKLGVNPNSFSYQCLEPGPLLGLMKTKNFSEALQIVNQSMFGLTSGLESLDANEQIQYSSHVETGSCYINRSISVPDAFRDPFGGCKMSSFGNGFKIGGPNFLFGCLHLKQVSLPKEKKPINEWVNSLTSFIEKIDLSAEELGKWYASVANYSYWWKRMEQKRDPSKIIGQDNVFGYLPRKSIYLRIEENSPPLDVLLVCAAALTCGCPLEISCDSSKEKEVLWLDLSPLFHVTDESTKDFLKKLNDGRISRLRLVEKAPLDFVHTASLWGCYIIDTPPLSDGRLELLHYSREIVISYDYHRHGHLGIREGELRKLPY